MILHRIFRTFFRVLTSTLAFNCTLVLYRRIIYSYLASLQSFSCSIVVLIVMLITDLHCAFSPFNSLLHTLPTACKEGAPELWKVCKRRLILGCIARVKATEKVAKRQINTRKPAKPGRQDFYIDALVCRRMSTLCGKLSLEEPRQCRRAKSVRAPFDCRSLTERPVHRRRRAL